MNLFNIKGLDDQVFKINNIDKVIKERRNGN